ncbi:MAG: DEAD/DEAH box helicase [Acidimicrobiales bacterium]
MFANDGQTPPRWRLKAAAATPAVKRDEPQRGPASVPSRRSTSRRRLYAWQAEALAAWQAAEHRGVVEAVTGTGKTVVGMAAARASIEVGGHVLVVVPSIELQRQWADQLRCEIPRARVGLLGNGRSATWARSDIIVAVVNSARSRDLGDPGRGALLVADECHRYGSVENAKALDERFAWRLGLSATYARSDDGNASHLDPYFGSTCFEMGYDRAIDDEVTAHFKVALVAVPFAAGDREAYEEANDAANDAQWWLIDKGHARAEPFGEFMKDVQALSEEWHGNQTLKARIFLKNFAERRRILAETATKREHLARLVQSFREADRSIVFTQTVDAADDAARALREHDIRAEPIHSKLDAQRRRQVLEQFASGGLQVITAPKVLDEGIDVPAADLAVILAASRSRRQMIQRMGRVLRRKDDGRLARFAILYIHDTSEDPGRGAHGEFLDEVTTVADDVRDFSLTAPREELCDYLNQMTPGSPQPAPLLATADHAFVMPPPPRPTDGTAQNRTGGTKTAGRLFVSRSAPRRHKPRKVS